MATYLVKIRNSNGSQYHHAFIAETLKEALSKVDEDGKNLMSIKHVTDHTNYHDTVNIAASGASSLLFEVQQLAKIADRKADLICLNFRDKERLAVSSDHYEVRLIVNQIKEKIELVEEYLDVILEFSEEKIDMQKESILQNHKVNV